MPARQQSLFETDLPPWEFDDRLQRTVATVVFPEAPHGEFDYLVPDEFSNSEAPASLLEPGRRVVVPLGRGNRRVTGYCVKIGCQDTGGRPLKQVLQVCDARSLLSPAMLRLTRWMADYYLCQWGQVLDAVVPAGVRRQAGTRQVTLLTVVTDVAARLTQLKLPEKQAAALRLLAASDKPLTAAQLAARAGCTTAPVNQLRKRGLIKEHVDRIDTGSGSHVEANIAVDTDLSLTSQQQAALDTILQAMNARRHEAILVHGVTGSGKTEVYIRAIQEVVRFGRQAIVLVPEISLTPQTVARFQARFPHVAILHSHQSDAERHRHWQRIAAGQVQVVVGARSAVFAPTPQLGLIILDEEHEPTFKQEITPRYHARDVARRRAAEEGIPLVLGSATPSLESWHAAVRGNDTLVEMPHRVYRRQLPAVSTIDLRLQEHRRFSSGALSRPLCQSMEAALRDGGQVILLLNRRGFSTHIQCSSCGHVVSCPHCDMSLTFHRQHNSVLCHYCEYEGQSPTDCPDCHTPGIRFGGLGTQKLEAEVRARFADYVCVRMDTDSMRAPGSHQQALDAFRAGDAHILLGTQMIAKGLDFPNVTLVGVVNADTALHLPDFRAAERTFQLVTQVAGRTGRGDKGGRVLVQTNSPDHPAILAAVKHDYAAFAANELPIRAATKFPPFGSLVRIVIRGEDEQRTRMASDSFGEQLEKMIQAMDSTVQLLGPAPAPMPKLRGNYRFHLLIHGTCGASLREITRATADKCALPDDVIATIDVDPVEML